MKILNGKEAFEAMMAGKKILCRAIGDLLEFNDLENFPATIFAMPGYEFSIKVETMELAGITFAKPLTLDDVVEDQEIFIVHPDHVSLVKYSKQNEEYFACVRNGFAQADNKNAVLQLEAMGKLFGRVICYSPTIDNTGKAKKKRSTKAKNDVDQVNTPVTQQPEQEIKTIYGSDVNSEEVFNTYKLGITNTSSTETIDGLLFQVKTDPILSADQINELVNFAETHRKHLSDAVEQDEPVLDDTDPAIRKFIEAIDKCNSDYELQGVERNLEGNKDKLADDDYQDLVNRIAGKRESFFGTKQSGVHHTESSTGNLSIAELKRLQEEAEKLTQNKDQDADGEYQSLLADLVDRASKANTPAEANTLVRYTKTWTEEQRKPLLDAIHKRLVQLNDSNEQPSLAVRIQRAEDLTELDALEIDVSACDPVIQPRLIDLIEQRRIGLESLTEAGEPQ